MSNVPYPARPAPRPTGQTTPNQDPHAPAHNPSLMLHMPAPPPSAAHHQPAGGYHEMPQHLPYAGGRPPIAPQHQSPPAFNPFPPHGYGHLALDQNDGASDRRSLADEARVSFATAMQAFGGNGQAEATVPTGRAARTTRPLYVAAWAALGALAFGYVGLTLVASDRTSEVASRARDGQDETAGLAKTLSRAVADVADLQRSVTNIETDVARVKTIISVQEDRERAIDTRLGSIESRIDKFAPGKPLVVAAEPKETKQVPTARADVARNSDPFAPRNIETGSVAGLANIRELQAARINSGVISSTLEPAAAARRSTGVLLATGPSIDALRLSWSLLQDRHKTTLKAMEARVVAADGGAYHLIAGPLASEADANKTCTNLRARGASCRAAEFKGDNL